MREDVEPKILERIRKMLAFADRTPNLEEAATFVAQASRLMDQHNVSEEAARRSIDITLCHETIFEARRITPVVKAVGSCLGEICFVAVTRGTRFDREEFDRAWNEYDALSANEKAKIGWRHPAKGVGVYTTLSVTGRPENVAMARYVLVCLKRQFELAAKQTPCDVRNRTGNWPAEKDPSRPPRVWKFVGVDWIGHFTKATD